MKENATTAHHHNTVPFSAAHAGPSGPADAPDASQPPAGESATRGRPSCYSDRIIEMMCGPIREFGLSDSAAAESVGMSSSTISRWKQQFPELGPKLQQAREGCRLHHLRLISKHAEAEHGRGWRAAAWLLERLFPGDYSPRMSERNAYRQGEERRREREAQEFRSEEIDEQLRLRKELDAQARSTAAAAEAAQGAAASERASHNSRNEAVPRQEPEPADADRARAQAWLDAFERDSHNARNAAEAPEASLAAAMCTASEAAAHNSRNASPRPVLSARISPSAPIF
jgi:hypothetical protein